MSSNVAPRGTRSTTRSNGQVRKRISVCARAVGGNERNARYSTMSARMNRFTSGLYGWWRELIGALIVLVSRIAIAPRTFWEHDELLFAHALRDFDPLRFHPHPPGYPLYVLLGKFVDLFLGDAFRSLVSISIVFAVIGFIALARLFRKLIDDVDLAVAGALIVYFSCAMLVHSVLPMSDGPAFALVALTLLAIAHVGRQA